MSRYSWRGEFYPRCGFCNRALETTQSNLTNAVVFTDDELTAIPGTNTLHLEGHYFPGVWRRFVRVKADGTRIISVLHPAKVILTLKVMFASERCARDGFIGLELYTSRASSEYETSLSFALTGPTGKVWRNLEGQVTAESIQCMYPRGELQVQRMLEYMMPEID